MPRTRFAEILSSRRKQLRLSIPQAAKVLRMRESVLEAFEEGDFEHLPPLGYAQGMVASYARYLGLDSRELTELYEREHADYVSGVTGHEPRGLARLDDEPGHRGPVSAASLARTSGPTPSPLSGRYGGSTGSSDYRIGPYETGASRIANPDYAGRPTGAAADGEARGGRERRYTTRVPVSENERGRRQQVDRVRRARSAEDAYGAPSRSTYRSGAGGSARDRDDITTRRVGSGQYRDDMRYDDVARPYRPSSTRAGREATRQIAAPERPRVRRRQQPPAGRDPRSRNRRPEPRRGGVAGILDALLSDSGRLMLVIGLVLAVVLVFVIVFSVRSCASSKSEPAVTNVVTAVTTSATTSSATASETAQAVLSEAAARQAAASAQAAAQETKVTVSVADGASTWVEIVNDGQSQIASTVTGAWSQDYTVTKSISIRVGDPSVVTVEKNGERQRLSGKTGGVASITIQGTDPSAATTASTTEAATTTTKSSSGQ